MLKQILKGGLWVLLALVAGACSAERFGDEPAVRETDPVGLSGALLRAAGDGQLITSGNPLKDYSGANFYLSARTAAGNAAYFSNVPMSVGDDQTGGRNKLNSQAFYPLGGTRIYLYAHTGNPATGNPANNIQLVSGTTRNTNDILFGKGTDADGNVVAGSAAVNDRIRYITFKHLMTRIEVKIEVADEVENQKPTAIRLTFNNNAVATAGYFNMLTETATAGTSDYALTGSVAGNIHYVVPSGKTLSGANTIKSLAIDDYTATAADVAAIAIPQAETGTGVKSDLQLLPGLSYTLTFQIKRLKLTGIRLTVDPWPLSQPSSGWDYKPYPLSLDITGESNDKGYDENEITKVVLKHTVDGVTRQYIGEKKGVDQVAFVTLPPGLDTADGLKADLYIEEGLLIKDIDVDPSTSGKLGIKLGEHGLKWHVDGYYEITTPLQFALTMNKPAAVAYRLTRDIDMDNNPIDFEPGPFPEGAVLDGAGHKILHLHMERSSGMAPVNNGTIKDIHIASGTIRGKGNYMGGICGTNNGVIEGCVNEAAIEADDAATVGGICGLNNGTILACLNVGNALKGNIVGGICGENRKAAEGAVKACLNVGLLNRETSGFLGGICGYSTVNAERVFETCFWLTGVARKIQATSNELVVGYSPDIMGRNPPVSSDLAEETIRSAVTVNKLSAAAATSWKFEMNELESSWPIPVAIRR